MPLISAHRGAFWQLTVTQLSGWHLSLPSFLLLRRIALRARADQFDCIGAEFWSTRCLFWLTKIEQLAERPDKYGFWIDTFCLVQEYFRLTVVTILHVQ